MYNVSQLIMFLSFYISYGLNIVSLVNNCAVLCFRLQRTKAYLAKAVGSRGSGNQIIFACETQRSACVHTVTPGLGNDCKKAEQ